MPQATLSLPIHDETARNTFKHRHDTGPPEGMLARFQNHNNVSTARCETRCGRAWPQCWWAAAGPGRASSRRAERRSRRGRRAGGPPPNSTHSGLNEHQQHWKRRRCGGYRRAWPQCWWAAAGPGRASSRRAEPKARGADGERAGRRPTAHTGARTRRPAPLDATTQTQLRSTCVRCRSAHAAHRSRRSSRSPRLRRRAGPRR